MTKDALLKAVESIKKASEANPAEYITNYPEMHV